VTDEIDDVLRRYRPAGPPPELRERVARATASAAPPPLGRRFAGVTAPLQGRVLRHAWLPPALAAGIAILFYLLASGVRADVTVQLSGIGRAREASVADLVSELGGGDLAREEAERLIELDEQAGRTVDQIAPQDSQEPRHD
jgi:hypothetical protein